MLNEPEVWPYVQLIVCTLLVLFTASALASASAIPELELSETDQDDYEWTDALLEDWLADRRVLSEQLDREPFLHPAIGRHFMQSSSSCPLMV